MSSPSVPLSLLRPLIAARSAVDVAAVVCDDAVLRLGCAWAGLYTNRTLAAASGVPGGPRHLPVGPGAYAADSIEDGRREWARGVGAVVVAAVDDAHLLAVAAEGSEGVEPLAAVAALALRGLEPVARVDEPEEEAPEGGASRRWLLVVDDDEGVREVVRQAVEGLGFATLGASTGGEGVALLGEHLPAVEAILLDLTLPDQPADRVYAALRAVAPDVPVILCSGYGEAEARRLSRAGPDVRFLPKPFDLRSLVRTLAGAMQ